MLGCFQKFSKHKISIIYRWIGSVFDEEDSDKKGFISENLAIRLIMQMNNRLLIGRIKHKIMVYHLISN